MMRWPLKSKTDEERHAEEFRRLARPWEGKNVQLLSDEELLTRYYQESPGTKTKLVYERELRGREAWAAPSGRVFWISCGALIVSATALLISILK